jgi:hypothetical protein
VLEPAFTFGLKVIDVDQGFGRPFQDAPQRLLAFDQRPVPEILAIQIEQIECTEGEGDPWCLQSSRRSAWKSATAV